MILHWLLLVGISLAQPLPEEVSSNSISSTSSRSQDIEMIFSQELVDLFIPVEQQIYSGAQIQNLMSNMRVAGDDYCSKVVQSGSRTRAQDNSLIVASEVYNYGRSNNGSASRMKTGCWNFLRMNDRHPDRDFSRVKDYYPEQNFDCYAIGFLQPYIMHSVLDCSHLTMLDFDWRIHDAHQQLTNMLQNQQIQSEETLKSSLADIDVGWVAYYGKLRSTHKASFDLFCTESRQELCKSSLMSAQEKWGQLNSVRFNVAGMHDVDFNNISEVDGKETIKVVFLSNAMEAMYTPRKEYNRMMLNIENSLDVGQKIILIHHVGGYAQFGMYEVERHDVGLKVRTVCRDTYTATASGHTEPTYTIWLDDSSTTKKAPSCRSKPKVAAQKVETPVATTKSTVVKSSAKQVDTVSSGAVAVKSSTPVKRKPAIYSADGNYMVQVSAFRIDADAEASMYRHRSKYSDILGEFNYQVVEVDLGVDKGIWYRVQAGPIASQSSAKDICRQLKEAGSGCIVVRK